MWLLAVVSALSGNHFSCEKASATSISPLSEIVTFFFGGVPSSASIALTTSNPSRTVPKTTCLPSSHGVGTVQMKNCDPLVPGPAFAIESVPAPVCLSLKFSSSNLAP